MVRKPNTAAPRQPSPRHPDIQVMTEAQALHALEEENRVLCECLAALEDERSRTQNPTPSPIPTPTPVDPFMAIPTPPPIPFKEPKIGEPPMFDGKASEFPSFLQQCKLYIRMKPITFKEHDDESRVAFIISRLRGVSAEWGQALLESNSPLLADYDAFLERLTSLYQNKERRTQLEDKLARLKQTGSASTFATEFSTLCEILGYPVDTRMGDFRLKLKPAVQTALAMLPAPATFDELVERVVRLDHAQYFLRKSENANHQSNASSQNHKSSQQQQSVPSNASTSHSKQSAQPNASASHASHAGTTRSASTPHPSYPRGPLSPEERERRATHKLCMYCGSPDHAIQDCPRLQSSTKKGYGKQHANVHAVSTTSAPASSVSSSITTLVSSTGNPPPQGSKRQDH